MPDLPLVGCLLAPWVLPALAATLFGCAKPQVEPLVSFGETGDEIMAAPYAATRAAFIGSAREHSISTAT